MRVGIRFSDNDFSQVVRRFLYLLKDSMEYFEGEDKDYSKATIVSMFNETAYGLDLMFQRWATDSVSTKKYLRIAERNVFLNEEIDEYMNTKCSWSTDKHGIMHCWDNGEFHYMDDSGIYSV